MDVLLEIVAACQGRVSSDAMTWLAQQRSRARHLVFRDHGRDESGMPIYEVGELEDLKRFSPGVKQAEPVRILYQLAKARGAFIRIGLGEPGKRRQEFAKRRLDHAIEAIGRASPHLADVLRNGLKVTVCGETLLGKIDSRGAQIDV